MRMQRNGQAAMAARRHIGEGDAASATRVCERALALAPRDPELLLLLGSALMMTGRHAEARLALNRAVAAGRACPVEAHCQLASLDRQEGRFEAALKHVDDALRADSANPACAVSKAELLTMLGRCQDAEACLRPHMRGDATDPRIAMAFADLARSTGMEAEAAALLAAHGRDTRIVPACRAQILFRLGMLLDKLDRCDEAFDAAEEANRLRAARFDARAHARAVDLLIERWSPEAVVQMAGSGLESQTPVFVVGVPRSGTSLVEQVLAAHPEVFGGDERPELPMIVARLGGAEARTPVPLMHRVTALTAQSLRAAGEAYLGVLHGLSPASARVTDKRPDNLLHLGLVSRMLPAARVVHCARDPRDVALSCYMHNFHGPYPWSFSLEGIASFIHDCQRLMAHWRTLPGLRLHEVRYERLVERCEEEERRLVEFVGLQWNEACARPHEAERVVRTASANEVRKPIYTTSVGRWKRYEGRLGGLSAAMEALGVEF